MFNNVKQPEETVANGPEKHPLRYLAILPRATGHFRKIGRSEGSRERRLHPEALVGLQRFRARSPFGAYFHSSSGRWARFNSSAR